jgi:hypothetical protein
VIGAGRALVSGVIAVMTAALLSTSPAWASGDLDQSTSFEGSGNFDETFDFGFLSQQLSQSFTAGVTGTLSSLGLGMAQQGSPTSLTLEVFAAAGGLPTGSALTSQTLTGSGLSVVTAGQAMFDVVLSSPIPVSSGSVYAIVARAAGASPAKVDWYRSTPYSPGTAGYLDAFGWHALAYDYTFATYVIPDPTPSARDSAPTDLLQQFERPFSESCEEDVPDHVSADGLPEGGWSPSWSQWAEGGAGGPVCTRTLRHVPSSGSWTVVGERS